MNPAQKQNPTMFDLFWLREQQVGDLCSKRLHHGPIDLKKNTNTEINIFQQCLAICGCVQRIGKKWAQDTLSKMQSEGRSRFTLSSEFLTICRENKINIPFDEINSNTYSDSIEHRLLQSLSPEKTIRRTEG